MPTYSLTAAADTPTWTAVLVFDEREVVLASRDHHYGTLRDVGEAAVKEAAEYLRAGLAGHCHIEMWHNTKARGMEMDRTFAYVYEEDGKVFIQKF